ncbi:MAG: metallophosphoesterase family protein [Candidatus Solibacter sp.]
MRLAIVSDIHGNRGALDAIVRDLRATAPDLVVHGGDLADGGGSPVEIVDRVRDLGWPGIAGNTDEMLFDSAAFDAFAAQLPQLRAMWSAIGEMAEFARESLGAERLAWLRSLPRRHDVAGMSLVHASPRSLWRAPAHNAPDAEFDVYRELGTPLVVYGHVHRPFVRQLEGLTVANCGSAGLPYDGDTRASYLLIDEGTPEIRRVEYDVAAECRRLAAIGLPHADWAARMLRSAAFAMP